MPRKKKPPTDSGGGAQEMLTRIKVQVEKDLHKIGREPGTRAKKRKPEEKTGKEVKNLRNMMKTAATKMKPKKPPAEFMKTGIDGFDQLLESGIPKQSAVLVAGGPGTGKTIFCLQTLANACQAGKKCIYISFEEHEDNLKKHMTDFGWDAEKWVKNGTLVIKRVSPYELSRSVEALLAKAKGELLIEFDSIPGIVPKDFKPEVLVVDSLTAIASAFIEKEDTYRIYIEQLFRLLEKMGTVSFLITETTQEAVYSKSGVEEFLADGVIAVYHIRKENVRVRGVEIIKLRGAKHIEKLVPFDIIADKGIVVYPEEEIFV